MKILLLVLVLLFCLPEAGAQMPTDTAVLEDLERDELTRDLGPEKPEEEKSERIWGNNFFAVPVPVSNPTFGTGLAVGAAYFYPQTLERHYPELLGTTNPARAMLDAVVASQASPDACRQSGVYSPEPPGRGSDRSSRQAKGLLTVSPAGGGTGTSL